MKSEQPTQQFLCIIQAERILLYHLLSLPIFPPLLLTYTFADFLLQFVLFYSFLLSIFSSVPILSFCFFLIFYCPFLHSESMTYLTIFSDHELPYMTKTNELTLCFTLPLLQNYCRAKASLYWKILKEMGIPDHLTCLLRNLYAGQEATIRTGHETID